MDRFNPNKTQPRTLHLVTEGFEPIQGDRDVHERLFDFEALPQTHLSESEINRCLQEYRELTDQAEELEGLLDRVHEKLNAIKSKLGDDFQNIFDKFDPHNFEPSIVTVDNGGK